MNGASDFSLDNRLALCADFVRDGAKVADIGTDHAYLPVWLCRIGRCDTAIAADINPLPLERGIETINNSGLNNRIEARLSNGLKKISGEEADDIVIAGMGGELISQIIENWEYSKDRSKHFILQPMTKSEELMRWLFANGFSVIKRDCCTAANKCYTVILAEYAHFTSVRKSSVLYSILIFGGGKCRELAAQSLNRVVARKKRRYCVAVGIYYPALFVNPSVFLKVYFSPVLQRVFQLRYICPYLILRLDPSVLCTHYILVRYHLIP